MREEYVVVDVGEMTAQAWNEHYRIALDAIKVNALAWHGDEDAKGRALGVIAKTADDALRGIRQGE